jgi:hypothetical protein
MRSPAGVRRSFGIIDVAFHRREHRCNVLEVGGLPRVDLVDDLLLVRDRIGQVGQERRAEGLDLCRARGALAELEPEDARVADAGAPPEHACDRGPICVAFEVRLRRDLYRARLLRRMRELMGEQEVSPQRPRTRRPASDPDVGAQREPVGAVRRGDAACC